jgi:hypothetical protein
MPYAKTYQLDHSTIRFPQIAQILLYLSIGYCVVIPFMLLGCQSTSNYSTEITKGMSKQQVIRDIGQPDIIEETSGDESRYYRPGDQIIYKYRWPESSTKTFFYLNRYLAITIVHDTVKTITPITEEKWGTLGLVLQTKQQINDNIDKLPNP